MPARAPLPQPAQTRSQAADRPLPAALVCHVSSHIKSQSAHLELVVHALILLAQRALRAGLRWATCIFQARRGRGIGIGSEHSNLQSVCANAPASSAARAHLNDALRERRQDEVWLPIHLAALGVPHHVLLQHAACCIKETTQCGQSTTRQLEPRDTWGCAINKREVAQPTTLAVLTV